MKIKFNSNPIVLIDVNAPPAGKGGAWVADNQPSFDGKTVIDLDTDIAQHPAWAQMVATSKSIGFPKSYANDLYVHDRIVLHNWNPLTFIWVLREMGTHIFYCQGDGSLAALQSCLRQAEGREPYYFFGFKDGKLMQLKPEHVVSFYYDKLFYAEEPPIKERFPGKVGKTNINVAAFEDHIEMIDEFLSQAGRDQLTADETDQIRAAYDDAVKELMEACPKDKTRSWSAHFPQIEQINNYQMMSTPCVIDQDKEVGGGVNWHGQNTSRDIHRFGFVFSLQDRKARSHH